MKLKNARNMVIRGVAFLALTLVISSCALRDLAPKGGYPENESKGAEFPALLPESEFDFHNSPKITS